MFRYVMVTACFVLALSGEAEAQRFSKEFFTVRLFGEHITVIASIDRTTKQHVAREFVLGNALSLMGIKPRTNRIMLYTFMTAFELGQRRFDILDILAGAFGIELNLFIRRFL